eukprot:2453942-Pyramimonas_sp.AAC.2
MENLSGRELSTSALSACEDSLVIADAQYLMDSLSDSQQEFTGQPRLQYIQRCYATQLGEKSRRSLV